MTISILFLFISKIPSFNTIILLPQVPLPNVTYDHARLCRIKYFMSRSKFQRLKHKTHSNVNWFFLCIRGYMITHFVSYTYILSVYSSKWRLQILKQIDDLMLFFLFVYLNSFRDIFQRFIEAVIRTRKHFVFFACFVLFCFFFCFFQLSFIWFYSFYWAWNFANEKYTSCDISYGKQYNNDSHALNIRRNN